MTYKDRIKPKSRKEVVWGAFLILIACTAFSAPFCVRSAYIRGRTEIQQDIIRAIETQDNVKIDRLIITSRNGRGNEFSVVFPAEKWEG